MDILKDFEMDKLSALLEDFKIEKFLPKLDTLWGTIELLTRIFVMAGPLILLGLGLWYFFAPPREANHRAGFRTPWGMGSVEAWLLTQKISGAAFSVTGFLLTLIMALIANSFRDMDPVDALQSAGKCLLWQAIIIVGVTVICHLIPLALFDWKGNRRSEKVRRK